jgi:hypothetical protein
MKNPRLRKSKKGSGITGPFVMHSRELLMSPAWRALSLPARRVLDRLEIEMMANGGPIASNGRLIGTHGDFIDYGVPRNYVTTGIRETVALGFVVVTEQGRGGNAASRRATQFRLTNYQFKIDPGSVTVLQPTYDWRTIKTMEEAKARAKAAKGDGSQKQNPTPRSGGSSSPNLGAKNGNSHPRIRGRVPPPNPGVPSISSMNAAPEALPGKASNENGPPKESGQPCTAPYALSVCPKSC